MKNILPCFVLLIALGGCAKKATNLWVPATPSDQSTPPEELPADFGLYQIDIDLLASALQDVGTNEEEGILLQFPDPDGNIGSFKVWKSSVVAEALLEKYPNLRAYRGFNIIDQSEIRIELPETGLQVMVRSSGLAWFIAPYDQKQQLFMTYHKSALPSSNRFWEGRIK